LRQVRVQLNYVAIDSWDDGERARISLLADDTSAGGNVWEAQPYCFEGHTRQ
jgi:hypothetical protein